MRFLKSAMICSGIFLSSSIFAGDIENLKSFWEKSLDDYSYINFKNIYKNLKNGDIYNLNEHSYLGHFELSAIFKSKESTVLDLEIHLIDGTFWNFSRVKQSYFDTFRSHGNFWIIRIASGMFDNLTGVVRFWKCGWEDDSWDCQLMGYLDDKK